MSNPKVRILPDPSTGGDGSGRSTAGSVSSVDGSSGGRLGPPESVNNDTAGSVDGGDGSGVRQRRIRLLRRRIRLLRIRAIQHYLVRPPSAATLGNKRPFRPLCGRKAAYPGYPGSRYSRYSRVFRVPVCSQSASFAGTAVPLEFPYCFWPKPASFLAKSRLFFWPKKPAFGQKRSRLLAKSSLFHQ